MKPFKLTTRPTRAGLIALLAVASTACNRSNAAIEENLSIVLAPSEVITVSLATIRTGVILTGTLEPYRRVEVKAQVAGTATRIFVDRGDNVRNGQSVVSIEAQGVQSQAASTLAGVAAAEAGVAQSRRQLESARTLREAGAMSDIDFQAVETQYQAAQAQVANALAQAADAAERAARTTVRSPIVGEVSERSVNEGEAVSVNQTLLTVVNSSILELQGQVPVAQAAQVREGQTVEFTIDAYPGQVFQGTVSRVAPVADPGTRQVGVAMRLANEDRLLIGGLFATGRVITSTIEQAVVIPQVAVRGTNGGRYVLVLRDDAVWRHPVTVGASDPTLGVVSILDGIEPGDRIIVSPGDVPEGTPTTVSGPDEATERLEGGV